MKRLSVLAFALTIALSTFAYHSDYSSSGVTIMYIVLIAWGILNIILFFKIWGMTNNVAMLKKKLVDHSHGEDTLKQCRKLMILGRKVEVKEIMINHFFDEVEKECDKVNYSYASALVEDFKKKPIAPYVNKLENNLSSIGEAVPENINKLATFGDYIDLVKIEK